MYARSVQKEMNKRLLSITKAGGSLTWINKSSSHFSFWREPGHSLQSSGWATPGPSVLSGGVTQSANRHQVPSQASALLRGQDPQGSPRSESQEARPETNTDLLCMWSEARVSIMCSTIFTKPRNSKFCRELFCPAVSPSLWPWLVKTRPQVWPPRCKSLDWDKIWLHVWETI